MKLRLRSTRLAKINWLKLRIENIPEKQVSGSHICTTWNLTLGMMHHYYLKTGKCWVEHTSGQNSSNLLLHSQLAPRKKKKNKLQNKYLVMGIFIRYFWIAKPSAANRSQIPAGVSLLLPFPLPHQKECFLLGLAFICKLLNLLSSWWGSLLVSIWAGSKQSPTEADP